MHNPLKDVKGNFLKLSFHGHGVSIEDIKTTATVFDKNLPLG